MLEKTNIKIDEMWMISSDITGFIKPQVEVSKESASLVWETKKN